VAGLNKKKTGTKVPGYLFIPVFIGKRLKIMAKRVFSGLKKTLSFKQNTTYKIVPLKQPVETTLPPLQSYKFILMGEDDADDEELIREVFSSIDGSYIIQFVNNGRRIVSNLDKLSDEQLPCLIVLDYNMPELNGADILRELKSNMRYDKIPKIIWSTSGSETYRKLCLELGANEYILKPTSVNSLREIARYMLSICTV